MFTKVNLNDIILKTQLNDGRALLYICNPWCQFKFEIIYSWHTNCKWHTQWHIFSFLMVLFLYIWQGPLSIQSIECPIKLIEKKRKSVRGVCWLCVKGAQVMSSLSTTIKSISVFIVNMRRSVVYLKVFRAKYAI